MFFIRGISYSGWEDVINFTYVQFNCVTVTKVQIIDKISTTTAMVENSKYPKFDDKIFLIAIHECSTIKI